MAKNIFTTKTGTTGTSGFPGLDSDLAEYAIPNVDTSGSDTFSATGGAAEEAVAAAPALEKIADIVSSINRKAYMSAPGRQEALGNIQRWQAGELDPSVYSDIAGQAAQTYGGAGFGVDSPAWQSAVQRAIVTNRQALQEKGGAALDEFYRGMPTTDINRYIATPGEYASAQEAARNRSLQLAELKQKGALSMAELQQNKALEEQRLALQREELAQQKALAEAQAYANLYAKLIPEYTTGTGIARAPLTGANVSGYSAAPGYGQDLARQREEASRRALEQASFTARSFFNL